MYYDDGYEELLELEKVKEEEVPEGYVRAVKLENGTVVQVLDLLLEFENDVFYEVKEPVGLVNPYFERTGKTYTAEQLNESTK